MLQSKKWYWLLWFLPLYTGCRSSSSIKEQQWQSLLTQKEYFKLRSLLLSDTEELSPGKKLYFQAFVNNAFNRNEVSIGNIRSLLDQYGHDLPDSAKAALLLLQESNYFKTYQYARAAETDSILRKSYRQALDSATLDNINNQWLIDSGLAKTPVQQAAIAGDDTISWTKDKVGLIEIPVNCKDSSWQAVFDTRANISCITETYAQKLGIRPLHVTYVEGSGATGNQFLSSLGIADSLRVGRTLLQHVVFQVMPDSILYIAPVDFRMNIIIGYPVIAQLREVHILKNGSLLIPARPGSSSLHNLAMDELNPIVSCIIGTDTLIFKFDTGASTSDLFDKYFRLFEKDIRLHAHIDTITTGGAGGSVRQTVFTMPEIRLGIGGKLAVLQKVAIHNDPLPNQIESFYGNLGQDIMSQFNETILNFQDMYLEFR